MQVVDGLKVGNDALKHLNDALNISDIEKILDETREGIEKQEEINALLGSNLTDEDEQAVEDELAGIIEEQLPEVPSTEPIGDETAEKERPRKEKPKEAVALEA